MHLLVVTGLNIAVSESATIRLILRAENLSLFRERVWKGIRFSGTKSAAPLARSLMVSHGGGFFPA